MNGRPLSFCMVTTFYPPHHFGGDATHVYRLSHELARRGHSVTVVCSPDAFHALGGVAGPEPTADERVVVHRLAGKPAVLSPLVTYLSGQPGLRARALERLFETQSFDVIHFHNVSLVGGPGVLSYGEGLKLYTTHEHWLVCPMHTLWRLDREPCTRPTCLRCTLSYRRPPQLWRYGSLLERQAQHVDLFLAPSRFALEMHRERGFAGPMRQLPHFVPDPGPAGAAPPASPTGRPYALVVGRLEKLKGVQTLIELFRRYDAVDLVVVGDGTYGAELRRRAAGLGHVRFLGSLPFDELGSLYRGALAVVAASVGYETFGLTTIEGFAHRAPAIVRDRGALPEVVADSGAGFVFRTEGELREALTALVSSPSLRLELGERGYRTYTERWTPEAHIRAYFDLIEEAGERRRAREQPSATRRGAR